MSGEVVFDGQPVNVGLISFESADGRSQPHSVPIRDGRYEATAETGLKPGSYLVRLTAPDLVKSPPNPNVGPHDPVPPTVPLLPPPWNVQSRLMVELKSGTNLLHFRGKQGQMPQAEIGTE